MNEDIPRRPSPEKVQVYVGSQQALQEYMKEKAVDDSDPRILVTTMDDTIGVEPDTEVSDQIILLYNADAFCVQKLRNQGFHIMGKEQS